MKPKILDKNPFTNEPGYSIVIEELKSVIMTNLTRPQAERALSLFLDSPINWDKVGRYGNTTPINYEIVIDKICVQCCMEFGINVEDILSKDIEYGAMMIRQCAAMTPHFEDSSDA